MKQEILSFLINQGLSIEHTIKKNIDSVKGNFQKALEERGLRLHSMDLAMALEEMSPQGARAAVNIILSCFQPFNFGLGLRVSHLTDERIEIVLPFWMRNKNEAGSMHEGALMAAATECARTLWIRHSVVAPSEIEFLKVGLDLHKSARSSLRARLEVTPVQRENILNILRSSEQAIYEGTVRFFDDNEILFAESHVELKIHAAPRLAAPEETFDK
jgi:acyl-coenzyme A thioesterase PaaI-like protein